VHFAGCKKGKKLAPNEMIILKADALKKDAFV